MNDATMTPSTFEVTGHRAPSYVLIFLGVVALFLPFLAGIAISLVLGIALLLAGLAYIFLGVASRGTGTLLWRILVGILFVGAGVDLILHPGIALLTLTLIVAVVFFIEAVAEIATFFALRSRPGSGWLLFNAVLTLVIALLIWRSWPSSATWAIGTLVGINLITSGFAPIGVFTLGSSRRRSLTP